MQLNVPTHPIQSRRKVQQYEIALANYAFRIKLLIFLTFFSLGAWGLYDAALDFIHEKKGPGLDQKRKQHKKIIVSQVVFTLVPSNYNLSSLLT